MVVVVLALNGWGVLTVGLSTIASVMVSKMLM